MSAPAVGDVNGDGTPDAVVVSGGDFDSALRGNAHELVVLDGTNGERLWAWPWHGGMDYLPPLIVALDGAGRGGSVCVGIEGPNSKHELVALGSDGRERTRIPLALGGWRLSDVRGLWHHADLDADAREELIYPNEGRLVASRADGGEPLWKWPLPQQRPQREYTHGAGAVVELRPASGNAPVTLALWVGRRVYGLTAATGAPRWRCDVRSEPHRRDDQRPRPQPARRGRQFWRTGQSPGCYATGVTTSATTGPPPSARRDRRSPTGGTIFHPPSKRNERQDAKAAKVGKKRRRERRDAEHAEVETQSL